MSTEAQWYLLQCKTQQHARAEQHLQNQEFDFFSPVHRVRRVVRGQAITRIEPLFPGYLFIRLNEHSNWRSLHATRGVSRLVSFNGSPHPVPDSLIAALRQRFTQQVTPEPLYRPGQRVMITEGCFRHVEAIVKAVTSDERIIVLMKILQSEQQLAFQPGQLAKAG